VIATDVFRQRFEAARARIADWIAANRDVATIEEELTPTFWRLAVTPHAAQTCAFEMILHTERQRLDLAVADETYEDMPAPPCEELPLIIAAIAAGAVLIRRHVTTGTGVPVRSETMIGAPDVVWHGQRAASTRPAPAGSGNPPTQARERRFVRYRL
jgi:hypothetical protein